MEDATAAMEVSSTSMNVASITAIAISQGFFPPGAEPPLAGCGVILVLHQALGRMIIYRCTRKPSGFQ
jgi:hypothetical protein